MKRLGLTSLALASGLSADVSIENAQQFAYLETPRFLQVLNSQKDTHQKVSRIVPDLKKEAPSNLYLQLSKEEKQTEPYSGMLNILQEQTSFNIQNTFPDLDIIDEAWINAAVRGANNSLRTAEKKVDHAINDFIPWDITAKMNFPGFGNDRLYATINKKGSIEDVVHVIRSFF